MSVNRANVIWPSVDGTWNIGFYDFYQTGDDYEWDVEYDYNRFNWASTGHRDENAAYAAWDGANPGSSTIYQEPQPDLDAILQNYLKGRLSRR